MIVSVALIVALVVTALTFGKFARSDGWHATVTPLASIIGSIAVAVGASAEG